MHMFYSLIHSILHDFITYIGITTLDFWSIGDISSKKDQRKEKKWNGVKMDKKQAELAKARGWATKQLGACRGVPIAHSKTNKASSRNMSRSS